MYKQMAEMATNMLNEFGAPAEIHIRNVVKSDKSWRDSETETIVYTGLNCAIFDYVKKFNKKGQVVESSNTSYIDVANLKDIDNIPINSVLITQGKKWSVKESEFIRPSGINTLLILWVSAYG